MNNEMICYRCRHYQLKTDPDMTSALFEACRRYEIRDENIFEARSKCDKEGDGRFVYFEPREEIWTKN